jgi:hypothetical protein
VVVDPDDKWKEPDENDNKISVDIEVTPKGGSDAGTAVAGMGGIAIIGGVLVAVFLVAIMVMYMLSASRKRKRVEQGFFSDEEGRPEGKGPGPEPKPKEMAIGPSAPVIIPTTTSMKAQSKDEKRDEEPDLPPEPSDEGSMGAPDPPAGHGTFAVAPLRMGPLKDEVPPDELDVTPETTTGESREEFTASGAGGPTMEAAGVEETAREEEEEELPPEPEPQLQEEPGVRVDKDAPPEPAPGPKEEAPGPEVKKEISASDDLERMLEELRKKREV